MLLIIFYGEFYSFHRPVMPRLESQLNHEEFKMKSELQIKNWKKKQCREEARSPGNFARVAKFPNPCKISQDCEFSQPANLSTHIVDFFYLFQICPYVIVILFLYLVNCICNMAYMPEIRVCNDSFIEIEKAS